MISRALSGLPKRGRLFETGTPEQVCEPLICAQGIPERFRADQEGCVAPIAEGLLQEVKSKLFVAGSEVILGKYVSRDGTGRLLLKQGILAFQ